MAGGACKQEEAKYRVICFAVLLRTPLLPGHLVRPGCHALDAAGGADPAGTWRGQQRLSPRRRARPLDTGAGAGGLKALAGAAPAPKKNPVRRLRNGVDRVMHRLPSSGRLADGRVLGIAAACSGANGSQAGQHQRVGAGFWDGQHQVVDRGKQRSLDGGNGQRGDDAAVALEAAEA